MTAKLTMLMARAVLKVIGIPKSIQHNIAVKTSSKALAKVFTIEFRFFKKKLVIIPIAALLNMIKRTLGSMKILGPALLNASKRLPCISSTAILHSILSMYMNTFCTKIFTFVPSPFKRYSL